MGNVVHVHDDRSVLWLDIETFKRDDQWFVREHLTGSRTTVEYGPITSKELAAKLVDEIVQRVRRQLEGMVKVAWWNSGDSQPPICRS